MTAVIILVAIVIGGAAIITLGSIWMGISYKTKKEGLNKGASKREIKQIQQDLSQIKDDLAELKKQIADLTIMVDNLT